LYFVFWTVVGLAFAGQHYLTSAKIGRPATWSVAITGSLADWYVFAVLSLPAVTLTRRFNLGGRFWRQRMVLHLMASGVFSLLWILVRAGLAHLLVPLRGVEMPFNDLLRYVLVATFFFNLIVYWVVVTGTHAVDYYRSLRERELRLIELERRLASAKLQALQMQLNPHFLFNALNGIGTLMYRDVELADAMLVKLAELLRHVLEHGFSQRVPLRKELAFLDRYLELEQMRFGDRLRVQREIDPACLDALVPSLLLQPLVENAIKHGVEPLTRPGTVVIRANSPDGLRLEMEVEDDGVGLLATPRKEGTGVGTSNVRSRLVQMYGGRSQFEMGPGCHGGVKVRLEIPLDTHGLQAQFEGRGSDDHESVDRG
jgi:signal transduction histidine kinase